MEGERRYAQESILGGQYFIPHPPGAINAPKYGNAMVVEVVRCGVVAQSRHKVPEALLRQPGAD
eukprot:scaffold236_cov419-Prasinococcus_capsulatus_cf.AAC.37